MYRGNAAFGGRVITGEELRLAAINSTGSGRGMSFWTNAASCGKRALLTEERDRERARTLEEPPYDPLKPAAFVTGGVYHKLHELWRQDKLRGWSIDKLDTEDVSVLLGAQLFDAYKQTWPANFWGEGISIEEVLTAKVGDVFVNAKPDLVVEMGAHDAEMAAARWPRVTAGRWIVDFKTEGREYDDIYYTGGLQALWYPLAWNQTYPDRPVDGIIFDIVRKPNTRAKVQSITADNFRAVGVHCSLNSADELVGLIAQGGANLERAERGHGNRAECVKFGGIGGVSTCQFFGVECAGA